MALYVKDAEVDALASKLASIKKTSKTEVLRQALRRELAQELERPSRLDQARAYIRSINEDSASGSPVTRGFIDSLYE